MGQSGALSPDPWTVDILGHLLSVDTSSNSQCQGSSGVDLGLPSRVPSGLAYKIRINLNWIHS